LQQNIPFKKEGCCLLKVFCPNFFYTQCNWQTKFQKFDIKSIDIRLINKWRIFGNTDIRVNLKNVKV
jgi:hypothetical protein